MPSSLGFEVEGLTTEFTVVSLEGEERISRPFRFDVELTAPSSTVAFNKVVNKPVRLTIGGSRGKRLIHGIVAQFEQGESDRRETTYRAIVVPELWRLLLRRDCRVFQEQQPGDIVRDVLHVAGFDANRFSFELSRTYAEALFTAQYREADLSFISRLSEDAGIWYAFKHTRSRCVVVFGDANSAFASLGTLDLDAASISSFEYGESVTSGKVSLRDFNPATPGVDLEGTQAGSLYDDLERYDFPGGFTTPGDGARRAGERWQIFDADRRGGEAQSQIGTITAGATFTLAGHPRQPFNREYLITEVRHHGGRRGSVVSYDNEFECVATDTPFRPERVTRPSHAPGVQSATVVGPTGQEIHVDEDGRVKLQFHWDREGAGDGNASGWVRVCQPWAGASHGLYFLPRVGDEVLVDFEHGDPSRPVVIGSLYNGANRPPYAFPEDKTRSGVKTASSPGAGGHNELRFEDRSGDEEVYIGAAKDLTITVAGNQTSSVAGDEAGSVDGSSSVIVGGNRTSKVGNDVQEEVDGTLLLDVHGGHTLKVGKDVAQDVAGTHTLKAATTTVEAGDTIALKAGAATLVLKKNGDISIEGKNIALKGSGKVTVRGAFEQVNPRRPR